MKLVIMQPYLFPYLGYFQLINVADKYVAYDDVNFIKQGWINRNKILVNNKEYVFTVPLKNISSFKLIKETEINHSLYGEWKEKFITSINYAYKEAPYFQSITSLIKSVFEKEVSYISELAYNSIRSVCDYLNVKTILIDSSECYQNRHLKSQDRIIDICKLEHASEYVNMIGGKDLYSAAAFTANNIQLKFIEPHSISYVRNRVEQLANLSIIDVLMFNSPDIIKNMLLEFDLLTN
jgi:hypothetical protein